MNPRRALATGGVAGGACVACCAPPLIGALGLAAGLTVAAAVFAGIAIAVTFGALLVMLVTVRTRRRRARVSECAPVRPVAVAAPTRRPPT